MNEQEYLDFKEQCKQAGFTEIDDVILKFRKIISKEYRDDDGEPYLSSIGFRVENGHGTFVFSSGLGHEFIHLNTMNPQEAANWGALISHIEPNW